MKIKLLHPNAKIPILGSSGAAGYDLFSIESVVVPSSKIIDGKISVGRALLPTGIAIAIPEGHVGKIGSRSGLSSSHNIEVGAGWIDPDYRGELKIELKNLGSTDFHIEQGDRIAQLFILKISQNPLTIVDSLTVTARGSHGFGSTGK